MENRIKKLKELEEQQRLLEQEIDSLKEEIKKELEVKGTENPEISQLGHGAKPADHPLWGKT